MATDRTKAPKPPTITKAQLRQAAVAASGRVVQVPDRAALRQLTKDLKSAAKDLSAAAARTLVDFYYQVQHYRIQSANQVRVAVKANEPSSSEESTQPSESTMTERTTVDDTREPDAIVSWLYLEMEAVEDMIQRALDAYTLEHRAGRWARSVTGVGPVISAGLLAHVDPLKAPTAGHLWRHAGLDKSLEWLGKDRAEEVVTAHWPRGEKLDEPQRLVVLKLVANAVKRREDSLFRLATIRADEPGRHAADLTRDGLVAALSRRPWNAKLKVLCAFKLGESFVKTQNLESDVYGHVFAERKKLEVQRNDLGLYADQAAAVLTGKRLGKDTEAYKAYSKGKLPPAHLHARARRYAVKLFLAHYQWVAYECATGKPPHMPFVLESDHPCLWHAKNPPGTPASAFCPECGEPANAPAGKVARAEHPTRPPGWPCD